MGSCAVCCDSFNKSSRTEVKCPYCEFRPCTSCAERYLIETTQDAHCMNCRKAWSREILVGNFTQKFTSRVYKTRRETVLFERERSLMPATQPYLEIEREIRRLTKNIDDRRKDLAAAESDTRRTNAIPLSVLAVNNNLSSEFDADILREKLSGEERKVVSSIMVDLQVLERVRDKHTWRLTSGNISTERRQFVRACPATNCRGFLSTAWKCGACDLWACPDCHEVKGPERDAPHTCDPNSIATAILLAKDSRNCPKCAAMIFKIDGCDQMFCTQCQTAFSWRTGRVETGTIHNPHYYEYRRAHGGLERNPGDVPCGGFPDWLNVAGSLPGFMSREDRSKLSAAHRSYGHCMWVIMPRYAVNDAGDNRDLRIKFMIADLTEDEFRKRIQQREKARQRKSDIHQVLTMYLAVLNDLFHAPALGSDLITSLDELRIHVNTTLRDISKRYTQCAVPFISDGFNMI